jgi:hypothetical protein
MKVTFKNMLVSPDKLEFQRERLARNKRRVQMEDDKLAVIVVSHAHHLEGSGATSHHHRLLVDKDIEGVQHHALTTGSQS